MAEPVQPHQVQGVADGHLRFEGRGPGGHQTFDRDTVQILDQTGNLVVRIPLAENPHQLAVIIGDQNRPHISGLQPGDHLCQAGATMHAHGLARIEGFDRLQKNAQLRLGIAPGHVHIAQALAALLADIRAEDIVVPAGVADRGLRLDSVAPFCHYFTSQVSLL